MARKYDTRRDRAYKVPTLKGEYVKKKDRLKMEVAKEASVLRQAPDKVKLLTHLLREHAMQVLSATAKGELIHHRRWAEQILEELEKGESNASK